MKFTATIYNKHTAARETRTVVADNLREARETLEDNSMNILALHPQGREHNIARLRTTGYDDSFLQELAMESAMLGEDIPLGSV